tara:strand:+ start:553 stop:1080 length:528 start_codon:yes stop_codon:yes gene_type:complete
MGTFPGGNLVRVTPTVIAGTTEDNDAMFDATEIPNAVSSRGGVSKLTGLTIIDKDGEQVDMEIIFMQVQTNWGTAGSATTITDANLQAAKVIGSFSIDWTDNHVTFAQDANNASIWSAARFLGTANAVSSPLPLLVQAAGGSTSIYFTAIVADSNNADYAATDDLEFVFHFEYLG